MNISIIVSKGFEKVAVMQVRELLNKKSVDVADTIVTFKTDDWDDVYRFIYKNQIAHRVMCLLGQFDYNTEDELLDSIKKLVSESDRSKDHVLLDSIISSGADFRVSLNIDEHTDVTGTEAEIGGILIEHARSLGHELKVNLKNPIMNFYIYVANSRAYVGIDLSGDLSKRDYKIFNNAVSLKGPTAFGLLMLAGYKPKDAYMNPYCFSGTIEIEAALYATGMSHRFYNKSFPFMRFPEFSKIDWDKVYKSMDGEITADKPSITGADKLLSSITASVKNAKIAGVESYIDFRRIDMDWMDIKFEKNVLDKIISFVPGRSSRDEKKLSKDFKQLFYQADYILKRSGVVVMMCLSKDLLIQNSAEYFDVVEESVVHSGGQTMHVLFFKKK